MKKRQDKLNLTCWIRISILILSLNKNTILSQVPLINYLGNKLRIKGNSNFCMWSRFSLGLEAQFVKIVPYPWLHDFIALLTSSVIQHESEDRNCLCCKELDLLNLQCLKASLKFLT
jgi:hypothetical protein